MKYAALLLLLVGCSTNQRLVAKATADHMYYEYRYSQSCPGGHGPAECGPCQVALHNGLEQIRVANQVYKLGYMPEKEKAELKALVVALEACP